MCFSATGSFATAGVLTAIGAVSLSRASSKPLRKFAVVPLFFAAQQAAEGIVWLTMGDSSHATLHRLAVNAFLAFALVVWPSWLPWSLGALERNAARRRILKVLSWWGAIVSLGAGAMLVLRPATAGIMGHSISYDYAQSHVIYVIGYPIAKLILSRQDWYVKAAKDMKSKGSTTIGGFVVSSGGSSSGGYSSSSGGGFSGGGGSSGGGGASGSW